LTRILSGAVICLPALLSASRLTAKETWHIQVVTGEALTYISQKGTPANRPRILPGFQLAALIPIERGISIKTGLHYQQKGWHTISAIADDTDYTRDEFFGTVKLHELAIPLMLSYDIRPKGAIQYSVAVGVTYGFFVAGKEEIVVDHYHRERLTNSQSESWRPNIALIPDDSRLRSTYEATAYNLFNTNFRLECGVNWRNKYLLHSYWEHSLTNVSSAVWNTVPIGIGVCGISLGVALK
jgi:hypothetical protein